MVKFWGHQSFLWGHWYPMFWTSGNVCSGLLSQRRFPHLHASSPACNGFFRFTVGVTILTSWWSGLQLSLFDLRTCLYASTGGTRTQDWAIPSQLILFEYLIWILWILLRASVLWLPNYWVTKYHFHFIFHHGVQRTPCMYCKQACMRTAANRDGQTNRQK